MTHPAQQQQPAPPGWYPNPNGQMQWWDGYQWGPLAPIAPTRTQHGGNGFAVTALVAAALLIPLVLISLLASTAWPIYTIGLVPIILALTFGFLGLHRAKSTGTGRQISSVAIVIATAASLGPIYMLLP